MIVLGALGVSCGGGVVVGIFRMRIPILAFNSGVSHFPKLLFFGAV